MNGCYRMGSIVESGDKRTDDQMLDEVAVIIMTVKVSVVDDF